MNDNDFKRALQQCESEPIHLIASIQPHGMLLVVGPEPERLILQVSQTVAQFFGFPVAELLNRPLKALPQLAQLEALCEQSDKPANKQFTAQIISIVVHGEKREFFVTPHHLPPLTLLELEPLARPYEYLRNMGVQASMSASLVVEGKLWGMIACHHHGPKQLGHPIREMVKFIAQTAATKIESLSASLRSALNFRLNDAISRMLDMLHHGKDMTQQLWAFEKYFATLIPATGILIRVDGRAYRRGVLPPDSLMVPLIDWLAGQAPVCVFNQLAEVFPGAAGHADTISSRPLAKPSPSAWGWHHGNLRIP